MIEAKILTSRGKQMVCLLEYLRPELRGKKVIIYKHGFCGNKITPHRMVVNLSHQLVSLGYTVIRFDCVGAGDSEGDWRYMTISGEVNDYKKVIHWAVDELQPEKLMLFGYSMGGLETAICSREVPLDGILFWSPCSKPYECFKHLLGDEAFIYGMKGNNLTYMGDRIGKEFFSDLRSDALQALDIIKGFTAPVYFIHGDKDNDVLLENTQNYLKILPQANYHIVKNANHYYDTWEQQDELFYYSRQFISQILK